MAQCDNSMGSFNGICPQGFSGDDVNWFGVIPQAAQDHVSRKRQRLIHECVTRCVTRC